MDPAPKPATEEEALAEALAEPGGVGFDGPPPSIDELIANEDVAGLLELGAAHRVGTAHVPHDRFKALECFEAASRLGSAQAEYLVGLAYMNGLGVQADLAEGAKRMRSAAQRGSLRAKVWVANLYELGVHYAVDRDKADVWYRNVARAAGIDADPDSEAYELAMAEIGCVRFCLTLVADEALPKKDRAFYLKKAKAMGYAQRLAQAKGPGAPEAGTAAGPPRTATSATSAEGAAGATAHATSTPASSAPDATASTDEAGADAGAEPAADAARGEPAASPRAERDEAPERRERPEGREAEDPALGGQWTFGAGMLAFLVAAFFAAAGAASAFLAHEGARALWLDGRPLPYVGRAHEVVLFGVLLVAGVLPATAAYRPNVVAVATVVGGAAGAAGWFAYPSRPLLWDAAAQAGAAGLAGFLLVLLFLGLLGGTRLARR